MTQLDVPHAGFAGLYAPAPVTAANPYGAPGWVADLWAAVCDSCGDAPTRVDAGRPPAEA